MKPSRLLAPMALAALTLSTGCATFKVQPPQLERVESAAVVGYESYLDLGGRDQAKGGVGSVSNTINAVNTMEKLSSGEYTAERIEQGVKVYDKLLQHLTRGTGWTWTPREVLTSTPAYNRAFQAHKAVGSGLAMTMGNYRQVPNLLQSYPVQSMSMAERNALMDALGVDAIAAVRVWFFAGERTGFAISGMGKTGVLPQAKVDLTVWDRSSEEPIWRDNDAKGEVASVGVETTMGVVNDAQLLQGMEEAAESALRVLMQRYLQAK